MQATASGKLIDPRNGNRLASFVQRYRLWTGRPILEIEITLNDLDPAWLEQAAPMPIRGRSTWPAAGPGPTPTRCSAARCLWPPS